MRKVLSKDVKKDNCVKHFRTRRIKMKKNKKIKDESLFEIKLKEM